MCSLLAKETSSSICVMGRFSRPFSVAVPPLPGATYTFCTFGLCASFQAMACSRPPEPITRSFMSVPEVAHAGEHHGHAALVRRGDDLVVAHAAAGLDHRGGAGFRQRVEPVAEREEGVGGDRRAGERQLGAGGLEGRD